MPLLKELSRTSRDSFESESDSNESRDVRLNSFKSGIFHFCHFWANYAERPGILSIQMFCGYAQAGTASSFGVGVTIQLQTKRTIQNATFEGIEPIVPGFFRIGFQFERIPGRSA